MKQRVIASWCHRVIVPFRLRAKRYGETSPKLEERRRAWLWVALGLVLTVVPLAAQQPAPPRPQATFETQSTIVLLDVVVRDKKGRPVRDLRPEELQVFENGQRRELTSFRLVEGQVSEERVAQATASGLQPDPNRQVSLVTMVFDKLMDGRQLSQQAALDFLANNMEGNVWVSVWTIDQRLFLRQEFTQDRYALRQAVMKATGTTSVAAASLSGEAAAAERLSREASTQAANLQAAAVGVAGGGPGVDPSAIGAANVQVQMAAVVAGILRFTTSIQRQQQGQSSLYPLLGLVKNQSRLAGRKTLLYFSEGLVVPKEPRRGLQDGDQRSQSRQRHRVLDRRARVVVGARFRRLARPDAAGRAHQPGADGQARNRLGECRRGDDCRKR